MFIKLLYKVFISKHVVYIENFKANDDWKNYIDSYYDDVNLSIIKIIYANLYKYNKEFILG